MTRGAVATGPGGHPADPATAQIWGFRPGRGTGTAAELGRTDRPAGGRRAGRPYGRGPRAGRGRGHAGRPAPPMACRTSVPLTGRRTRPRPAARWPQWRHRRRSGCAPG
ncbi:hypothetical protein LT493_00370 [Streptomyces tricolor]|nr:hypothetical protein [Streptomyces tricolor]